MVTSGKIAILLIFAGTLIMAVCIVKYYSTLLFTQKFKKGTTTRYETKWYKMHHLLMVFFLIGYIFVGISIVNNSNIIGELFVSLIFFLGANFVLIGIILQNKLLYSIELQQNKYIEKNNQLNQLQDANIFTLAYLAEIRDTETGKHIERTSMYVRELAIQLSILPKYKDHLTTKYVQDLVKSAPLHDIGKVGVEDSILRKPGKLTDDEFENIKRHCEYGANVLTIAESKVTFRSYLAIAIPLVRSHHERWDGKGYPDGLKGDQIPLSAQIMAIADVYDALRSERCYKKAISHDESIKIIVNEKEKQFAPDVVEALLKCERKFNEISLTHSD